MCNHYVNINKNILQKNPHCWQIFAECLITFEMMIDRMNRERHIFDPDLILRSIKHLFVT